ncbi:MAG: hypothetical protein ABJB05_07145 [Parafilimonas sp.]
MLREIIKPTGPFYTMRLPEEMVGKTVEVIAFEVVSEDAMQTGLAFEDRVKRIKAITKNTLVDLTGFKFNRDEANSYDA